MLSFLWLYAIIPSSWDYWTLDSSVYCHILAWQPAPLCFQGFRKICPAKQPVIAGFAPAGSCCTLWSTIHPCWARGSTFRHCRPLRVSWMGPRITAPRQAVRKKLGSQLPRLSSPPKLKQTRRKLTEVPKLYSVIANILLRFSDETIFS